MYAEQPMMRQRRERDPEEEKRERERYILLQHLYTVSQATPGALLPERRLWEDLGFSEAEALPLLRSLHHSGYVRHDPGGLRIAVTRRGIDYIERGAGRRRTVRLVE